MLRVSVEHMQEHFREIAIKAKAKMVAEVDAVGLEDLKVEYLLREGKAADVILKVAESIDRDSGKPGSTLLVMGSNGRDSLKDQILGSVAERIVRQGLEKSGQNGNLLGTYWMTLMVLNRYEEAETMVRDLMLEFGESLPDALRRRLDFQLGMIAFVREDFPRAYNLLNAAIGDEDQRAYNEEEIWIFTMASLASAIVGKQEEAESRLADAERKVQRARLNGVDNPGIYYSEAVLLAMREQSELALEKLNQAYQRGFRALWILNIDGRLDSLREQPGFIALQNRITDDVSRALAEIKSVNLAFIF
ncbi:MAG: universal stress protein [Proteobacteria bacterium]|nr:universal stress protein [Pseudomonadota bacterium]